METLFKNMRKTTQKPPSLFKSMSIREFESQELKLQRFPAYITPKKDKNLFPKIIPNTPEKRDQLLFPMF